MEDRDRLFRHDYRKMVLVSRKERLATVFCQDVLRQISKSVFSTRKRLPNRSVYAVLKWAMFLTCF